MVLGLVLVMKFQKEIGYLFMEILIILISILITMSLMEVRMRIMQLLLVTNGMM